MFTQPTTVPVPDLPQTIRRKILDGTRGSIQALEVEATGGRIVVRGRAPSFHVKQLAIEAIREMIGAARISQIDIAVQITVDTCTSDPNVDGDAR